MVYNLWKDVERITTGFPVTNTLVVAAMTTTMTTTTTTTTTTMTTTTMTTTATIPIRTNTLALIGFGFH